MIVLGVLGNFFPWVQNLVQCVGVVMVIRGAIGNFFSMGSMCLANPQVRINCMKCKQGNETRGRIVLMFPWEI